MGKSSNKKMRKPLKSSEPGRSIVLDEANGLVFANEEELYRYFEKEVEVFEDEFLRMRPEEDYGDEESERNIHLLDETLEYPDEIWEDTKTLKGKVIHHYLKFFEIDGVPSFYVAVTHTAENMPTFIYLHFPTKLDRVADRYRRGEMVYDRVVKEVENGALEGDALGEGDDLAVGLYKAMLKLRSEGDIPEDEFAEFSEFRDEAIHEADEIWKSADYSGQVLVNFIREYNDVEGIGDIWYIVVTVEESTNSQVLLFSFPTTDASLVDRYRQGENLQAEEVLKESSH